MTEEEAKTKRCCGPEGTGTTINPDTKVNMKEVITGVCIPRWCIASDCMGWQWVKGKGNTPHMTEKAQAKVDALPQDQRHGYCGLAK